MVEHEPVLSILEPLSRRFIFKCDGVYAPQGFPLRPAQLVIVDQSKSVFDFSCQQLCYKTGVCGAKHNSQIRKMAQERGEEVDIPDVKCPLYRRGFAVVETTEGFGLVYEEGNETGE